MWKLVFKLDNDKCEKNLKINLHALEVLSSRNLTLILDKVEGDNDYYSNIASTGTPLSFLVYYLSNNHQIYDLLSADARLKIDHCINNDDVGKTVGWFIKADLDTHGNDVEEWIKSEEHPTFTIGQMDALLEISDTEEWQKNSADS